MAESVEEDALEAGLVQRDQQLEDGKTASGSYSPASPAVVFGASSGIAPPASVLVKKKLFSHLDGVQPKATSASTIGSNSSSPRLGPVGRRGSGGAKAGTSGGAGTVSQVPSHSRDTSPSSLPHLLLRRSLSSQESRRSVSTLTADTVLTEIVDGNLEAPASTTSLGPSPTSRPDAIASTVASSSRHPSLERPDRRISFGSSSSSRISSLERSEAAVAPSKLHISTTAGGLQTPPNHPHIRRLSHGSGFGGRSGSPQQQSPVIAAPTPTSIKSPRVTALAREVDLTIGVVSNTAHHSSPGSLSLSSSITPATAASTVLTSTASTPSSSPRFYPSAHVPQTSSPLLTPTSISANPFDASPLPTPADFLLPLEPDLATSFLSDVRKEWEEEIEEIKVVADLGVRVILASWEGFRQGKARQLWPQDSDADEGGARESHRYSTTPVMRPLLLHSNSWPMSLNISAQDEILFSVEQLAHKIIDTAAESFVKTDLSGQIMRGLQELLEQQKRLITGHPDVADVIRKLIYVFAPFARFIERMNHHLSEPAMADSRTTTPTRTTPNHYPFPSSSLHSTPSSRSSSPNSRNMIPFSSFRGDSPMPAAPGTATIRISSSVTASPSPLSESSPALSPSAVSPPSVISPLPRGRRRLSAAARIRVPSPLSPKATAAGLAPVVDVSTPDLSSAGNSIASAPSSPPQQARHRRERSDGHLSPSSRSLRSSTTKRRSLYDLITGTNFSSSPPASAGASQSNSASSIEQPVPSKGPSTPRTGAGLTRHISNPSLKITALASSSNIGNSLGSLLLPNGSIRGSGASLRQRQLQQPQQPAEIAKISQADVEPKAGEDFAGVSSREEQDISSLLLAGDLSPKQRKRAVKPKPLITFFKNMFSPTTDSSGSTSSLASSFPTSHSTSDISSRTSPAFANVASSSPQHPSPLKAVSANSMMSLSTTSSSKNSLRPTASAAPDPVVPFLSYLSATDASIYCSVDSMHTQTVRDSEASGAVAESEPPVLCRICEERIPASLIERHIPACSLTHHHQIQMHNFDVKLRTTLAALIARKETIGSPAFASPFEWGSFCRVIDGLGDYGREAMRIGEIASVEDGKKATAALEKLVGKMKKLLTEETKFAAKETEAFQFGHKLVAIVQEKFEAVRLYAEKLSAAKAVSLGAPANVTREAIEAASNISELLGDGPSSTSATRRLPPLIPFASPTASTTTPSSASTPTSNPSPSIATPLANRLLSGPSLETSLSVSLRNLDSPVSPFKLAADVFKPRSGADGETEGQEDGSTGGLAVSGGGGGKKFMSLFAALLKGGGHRRAASGTSAVAEVSVSL
ncbi:hypothetical protein DFJ73DRAFT_366969 [Zopfochytrium polystomum]|nr:hypothetical protein DFJ73DRAFT_366969 [Zopfochytrium polystomum]